jgi:hypothetical protein
MWSAYWFPITNNTRHFYKILNMYFPRASHFLNSNFAYIFIKKCRNIVEQSPVLLQRKSKSWKQVRCYLLKELL